MKKMVTEYYITYKESLDDFITESKKEAEQEFKNTNKQEIQQYFRKDWILADGEYQEDYVEVYFSSWE